MGVTALYRGVRAAIPGRVPAPGFLQDALADTDLPATPDEYAAVTAVAATLAALLGTGATALAGLPPFAAASAGATAAVVVAGGALAAPVLFAARRDARRVGALPGFVLRAALAMRVTPTLEAGVAAVRTTGPLGTTVPAHAPPRTALHTAVADLPAASQRAVSLLVAAGTADDPDLLLERAVATARDATTAAARTYAAGLHGPVTALYAFGVVLPLALVGVLPALPVAGVRVPLGALAVALDVLLPLALLGALAFLLVDRPRTTGTPPIPRDALGTPAQVAAAAVLAATAGVALARVLPAWSAWLLPAAWGVGAALLARYAPAGDAVDHATAVRDAAPDLLVRVGTELSHGAPPETALTAAGDAPGMTATLAGDAARVRARLGIAVPHALTGDHGPLAVLPAGQRRTLTALLRVACDAGADGGRALTTYAGDLDDRHGVERDLRDDLGRLTGTLTQTAAVYAPLIGGVTIALATHLRATAADLPPPQPGFPLVVGGYVLVLAVVLPAFTTLLVDGPCRVRVGTSVGSTLLAAAPLLPGASLAAGLLL